MVNLNDTGGFDKSYAFSVVLDMSIAINLNNFILFNSTGPQLNLFIVKVYTNLPILFFRRSITGRF